MNYLAHAYFSLNNHDWLVGNMISDTVKGRHKFDYSTGIQQGIALHRLMDTFTDASPVVKQAMQILEPGAGRYAGPFIDIAFDYFLANDPAFFPDEESLAKFAQNVYKVLAIYTKTGFYPAVFERLVSYMRMQNWLFNYRFTHGICKSFNGLTMRAKYLDPRHNSFELFLENMESLQQLYNAFIPRLSLLVVEWAAVQTPDPCDF